jgi:phospholipid-binding lipoprotein MlaA
MSNAMKNIATYARWMGVSAVLSVLAACATGPQANPLDPLEPFNRGVTRFNDVVDENVLVPVATTYTRVLPSLVRTGVANFFNNVGDVWNLANNVAQAKLQNSAQTFMRLNVNTIFGLGGLLDIATEAGIDRHDEDFGQTLGYWGVGSGPYLVLPLLGPSTVRDTAALPVDRWGDPLSHMNDVAWRNSLNVLNLVDTRAKYLRAGRLLDDAALDKYTFTRDAYLQHRRSDIYDGNPPDEREDIDGKDGKGNDGK